MGARTSSAHVMSAQIMPDKVILTLYTYIMKLSTLAASVTHDYFCHNHCQYHLLPCYALESVLTLDKASEVI